MYESLCCFHILHHFWLNDLNLHIENKKIDDMANNNIFQLINIVLVILCSTTRPKTRMNITTTKCTFMKTNFFEETGNSRREKIPEFGSIPSKVFCLLCVSWCNDDEHFVTVVEVRNASWMVEDCLYTT